MPSKRILTVEAILANTTPAYRDCLIWNGACTGGSDGDGYPEATSDGVVEYLHELVWELSRGRAIPEGACPDGSRRYEVHHLCDHRRCLNADHLLLVSQKRHSRIHRNLRWTSQATCAHGHHWKPETTYLFADGSRSCKLCRAQERQGTLPPKQKPELHWKPCCDDLTYLMSAENIDEWWPDLMQHLGYQNVPAVPYV